MKRQFLKVLFVLVQKPRNSKAKGSMKKLWLSVLVMAALNLAPAKSEPRADCGRFVGQWTLHDPRPFEMVLNADGTGSFTGFYSFQWTCVHNELSYTYLGMTLRLKLTSDGTKMAGTGMLGEQLSAVRISTAPAIQLAKPKPSVAASPPPVAATPGLSRWTPSGPQ